MKKIDIHTHILPQHIPRFKDKFGYGGFIELHHDHSNCTANMVGDDGKFFRKVEANCFDPMARIKDCENHQIAMQVLSTVPVMFNYWAKDQDGLYTSQYINDHIANTVAKYPSKFYGLGTLPLQNIDLSLSELERVMKVLKLQGVQIGSHVNQYNLNDPIFFPFYHLAEKLGAAIFIHPWDMMGSSRMEKYWLPWLVGMPAETSLAICSMIFGGIFEKFPNLKVAFAHGGGSFPSTIGRIEHGYLCRPDLCAIDNPHHNPRSYLGKFWLDTLVHDETVLMSLINLIGHEKLALGSDYPFPLGENRPGELIEKLKINHEIKEWLNYKSALNWLGVKE